MKITVNKQLQRFYLATDKWAPAVGHEIMVGDYQFCAIPVKNGINVSEVSSGARLIEIPHSQGMVQSAEDKEGTMELFMEIGKSVNRIIGKQDNFDAAIKDMKKMAFDRLGEKPATESAESLVEG